MRLFDPAQSAGWIIVVGWSKFQHYGDRRPIWIKTYLDLLDRDDYLDLPGATRAVLHGIWLLTAKSPEPIRADTRKLSRTLNLKVTSLQLEALQEAGFIQFAASRSGAEVERPSRASARAPAGGEGLTSLEENPPSPPKGGRPLTRRDLRPYTGCQATRGSHGASHRHTTLGTDKPPTDWPHPPPDERELRAALARQWIDQAGWREDDQAVRDKLNDHFGVNGDDELELRDLAAERRAEAGAA